VPKSYVDEFRLFKGITDFEANWWNGEEVAGLRHVTGDLEAFAGLTLGTFPTFVVSSYNNATGDASYFYYDRANIDVYVEDRVYLSAGRQDTGRTTIVGTGFGSTIRVSKTNELDNRFEMNGNYVRLTGNFIGVGGGVFEIKNNGFDFSTDQNFVSSSDNVHFYFSSPSSTFTVGTPSSSTFKGIEYNSDYSAQYVDRSLTDKAYVDLHDTIIVNIPCFKFNETVTTGECGFFAVPNNLIGDDIIGVQFAYGTAGTGSTSDVQLSDGFLGFFGATMADGDRVETVTNGGAPVTMTSEQVIYVSVVSTSTTPAEGLSVNLTILKKR